MLVGYSGHKEVDLVVGDLIRVKTVLGTERIGIFLGVAPHSRPNMEWGRFNWVHVLFGTDRSYLNSNLIFSIEKL